MKGCHAKRPEKPKKKTFKEKLIDYIVDLPMDI